VQVLGGNGYLREFSAERMMRDAKVPQIYEGANEIQQLVIARQMLKAAGEREPIWPEHMPGSGDIATKRQRHVAVKQPLRAMRSLVTACTARTAATAARVGTLMSNGLSSPAPSEMADEISSGRRRASA